MKHSLVFLASAEFRRLPKTMFYPLKVYGMKRLENDNFFEDCRCLQQVKWNPVHISAPKRCCPFQERNIKGLHCSWIAACLLWWPNLEILGSCPSDLVPPLWSTFHLYHQRILGKTPCCKTKIFILLGFNPMFAY